MQVRGGRGENMIDWLPLNCFLVSVKFRSPCTGAPKFDAYCKPLQNATRKPQLHADKAWCAAAFLLDLFGN